MDLVQVGARINDVYQVEWELGEGAFAKVYRVRHRYLGRQAMKVFKGARTTQEEVEALLSEARLLSQYTHPNLVQVFDAGVLHSPVGSVGFFTMTHVAGGTLANYWTSFGSEFMPVGQAVEIGRQVCRGLEVAHRSTPSIIHRDIKPQNILVGFGPGGLQVRLSDFGLAKQVSRLSMLASARGTPAYKAPEALESGDSTSSDIFAIGATLYQLLTDRLPFPILDDEDWMAGPHFKRSLRAPSQYNIHVDALLEAIVIRCLAMDPRLRYQNASELLADLDHWHPGKATTSSRATESMPVPKSSLDGKTDSSRRAAAQDLLQKALANASNPSALMDAADLLEAALTQDPSLGQRFESRLKLWRRGISM
jgi:serine/threonine-protein kinase